MANELRLPIVRLIDGTGGGGSVKTLETDGRTYVPYNPGWDWVVDNLATVPVVGLGLGSVAGLGAARLVTSHYSVMVEGHLADVRRRPAGGGAHRREGDQGGTRRQRHPCTRDGAVDDEVVERGRKRSPARAASCPICPRRVYDLPPRGPVHRRSRSPRRWLHRGHPARPAQGLQHAQDHRELCVDTDSFFEIGAQVRRLRHHRPRAPRRLAGGGDRRAIRIVYGGGWTADASHEGDALHRLRADLPSAGGAPRRHAGLPHRRRRRRRRPPSATARARWRRSTRPRCRGARCWCASFRRGRRRARQITRKLQYRYAWPSGDWGSLPIEGGIEAAYRAELEAAADPAKLRAEIEERLNEVRSPFRTAEAFRVEEIIDPRDTRPLLCEFANLAAPLRQPGTVATSFRP